MTLVIDRLSKLFGNTTWALRDVSMTASSGRSTGILGGNGSGKSTLLRIIAGLEARTSGTVEFNGTASLSESVIVRSTKKRSGIAGIFGAVEPLTASERLDSIERAIRGERKLVLLDEPFAGIDDAGRRRIAELIRSREGKTVLVASSDLFTIAELCDDCIVLANGEMIQSGTVESIYLEPENTRTAQLSGRINLIEARRVSNSNDSVPEFYTIAGEHRIFARRSEKAALGAINRNVHLAIRPEHLSMPTDASFPEDNLLKAVVTGIRFLGAATRVEFDANGLRLEALVPRIVGLDIGEECMVALPPPRLHILKD